MFVEIELEKHETPTKWPCISPELIPLIPLQEATRSIVSPLGWDASPSQAGYPQHFGRFSRQFAGIVISKHKDSERGSNTDLSIQSPVC